VLCYFLRKNGKLNKLDLKTVHAFDKNILRQAQDEWIGRLSLPGHWAKPGDEWIGVFKLEHVRDWVVSFRAPQGLRGRSHQSYHKTREYCLELF